jgi:sugar transferase (PEP-CTERM system associated)
MRLLSHWFFLRISAQMLLDMVLLCAAVVGSFAVLADHFPVIAVQVCVFATLFAACLLMLQAWGGLYHRTLARSRVRAAMVFFLVIPMVYVLLPLTRLADASRWSIELSILGAAALILFNRVRAANDKTDTLLVRRILILGTGSQARDIFRAMTVPNAPATIVGFYPGPREEDCLVPAELVLPTDKSLSQTALDLRADEIVVTVTERRGDRRGDVMPLDDLLTCKLQGILVHDWAGHFEKTFGLLRLDSLSTRWLVFGDGFSQGLGRTAVKRVFDIVVASILLLIALPIMLLTALLIVIEDGWPILYSQERVGLEGRRFRVVKFRSMRRDAEKEGQPVWASAKDGRITRVGRIIRTLRIDELPQLVSVLNGDMSLVGPRPERPYFVEQLAAKIPFYNARHSVKPGLTGWAQVRYHYGGSIEDTAEKLQYDLYYVKNHSLLLDVIILYATVSVVLTGKGAH